MHRQDASKAYPVTYPKNFTPRCNAVAISRFACLLGAAVVLFILAILGGVIAIKTGVE